jgi:hypothetical protein
LKRLPGSGFPTGHKKPLSTYQRHPIEYYKHIYINQSLFEAIDFLAVANRTNRKKMVEEILKIGIGRYLADKISESNAREAAQRRQGLPVRPTGFVHELHRWARSKGKDIGKFI